MRLVILTGSLAGTTFEVTRAGLTVGRRPECEVRFGDADNRVSGLHARISWRDGAWILRDERQPQRHAARRAACHRNHAGERADRHIRRRWSDGARRAARAGGSDGAHRAAQTGGSDGAHRAAHAGGRPIQQQAKSPSGLPPLSVGARDLGALPSLLLNPVGGLSPAYAGLGPDRALGAGLALCVVFAIVSALGTAIGSGQTMMMFGVMGVGANSFTIFLRALIGFLVLPAAMIGASLGARKILSGSGPLAADVFTIGAALTPLGLALLLSSFLGLGNYELSMLLMLFALTYLVLMLFTGLTTLGGLTEKAAAPAVPIVFVLSLYICKVVFAAMI